MTANQINYQKLLEDIRTHKATEAISSRQASAAERQAASSERQAGVAERNAETNVANSLINESAVGAQWYGAQANAAYQRTMSQVAQAQQEEAIRHNKAAEANELIKSARDVELGYYKTQVQEEVATADREAAAARNTETNVTGLGKVLLEGAMKVAIPGLISLLA